MTELLFKMTFFPTVIFFYSSSAHYQLNLSIDVYQLSIYQYARRKHCKGKVADNGSSPQLTNLLNVTHYRKETTRLLRNLCSNPSRTASSQTLSGKETCANVRIVLSFFMPCDYSCLRRSRRVALFDWMIDR